MATNSKWMRGAKSKVKLLIDQAIAAGLSKTNITELAGFIVGLICEYRQEAYIEGVRETEAAMMKTGIQQGELREVTRDETTMFIPWVLWFPKHEGAAAGFYFWDPIRYGVPEKGEFFVVDSATEAYLAREERDTRNLIVKRSHLARKFTFWRRDEKKD